MKLWKTLVFGLVMIVYLWFPYQMITGYEGVLKEGTAYRFRCEPIDPYDAFRGRYLVLNYPDLSFKSDELDQFRKARQKIFAVINTDGDGFAQIAALSKTPPDQPNYIQSYVSYFTTNKVVVAMPENMLRYYLNEKLAPQAEQAYGELSSRQRRGSKAEQVYVDARVLEGRIAIEEVYFKGLSVGEYLQQ